MITNMLSMNAKLRTMVAAVLIAGAAFAAVAQEEAFKRAAKLPGVEYVYLSKDMLSKVGNSLPVEGMDEVASQLTSMELLSTSSHDSAKKAFGLLDSSRSGMELLTHMSENDGTVDIYGVKSDDKLSELLVLVMKDSVLSAVMMKGTIDPEVIKGIAAAPDKK